MAGELHQMLVDLRRELAGGSEDEAAGDAWRLVGEAVQDGQQERRRLAASGHGTGEDVAAGHGRGDGIQLNGGGLRKAHVRNTLE